MSHDALRVAYERAVGYVEGIGRRQVCADTSQLARLRIDLPAEGMDPPSVIRLLDEAGSPATVASTGGRYFGFVTGGSLPAAMAAGWLAGAWDQNAAQVSMSPVAALAEEVALRWCAELLGLPALGGGLVTGATMANFTALAAARHAVLSRAGWDVERDGLFGAPPITVLVGEEAHVSLVKALGLLGLGRDRVVRVPADGQGRMTVPGVVQGPAILCIQAGNVNTGAFDPAPELCAWARDAGAWVHVDGAFGLWAAACPETAHLTSGYELADSWSTDAHKWPNIPYDCGIALVKDPVHLHGAMSMDAAYLGEPGGREPRNFAPEMSRRARGVELWAGLLSLGRNGMADLVRRTCRYARLFAEELREFEVLNEVVLNQVLVSFGDDATTQRVIRTVQDEGACWCGGTRWKGRAAMRISVSSWATAEEDVRASVEAIRRSARR
jgi:glutamate/tyrosine decarboxylase-like PLP-dependent enzyme